MKLLFRILVTGVIFALIFRSIDLNVAWATLKQLDPALLCLALLMQFASTNAAILRWHLLMQNLRMPQPFGFYWRSYFKGMFFNQALPTSIGGDALRVVDVYKRGFRKRDALHGVLLDRGIGLAALLLLNVVANAFDPTLFPRQIYHLINLVALAGLVGFCALLLPCHLSWFHGTNAWLSLIRNLSRSLNQAFCRQRVPLATLSILTHLFTMFCICATGRAVGLDYSLLTYFIVVPPALLFTLIPVSLAGWGVREGAMVALFSLIGGDTAAILTVSILYGLMLALISIPGLIVFLGGRKQLAGSLA
jgi:hypothetical protein